MSWSICDFGTFYKKNNTVFFFGNKYSTFESLAEMFPHIKLLKIQQVHGDDCIKASKVTKNADAHFTTDNNTALCILTADCIPILILFSDQKTIAAVHAGWRGVANGILVKTIKKIGQRPEKIFIGPHIQKNSFEVNFNVAEKIFDSIGIQPPAKNEKQYVDLKEILLMQMKKNDIDFTEMTELKHDTLTNENYHSYRRNKTTQRQISFIAHESL